MSPVKYHEAHPEAVAYTSDCGGIEIYGIEWEGPDQYVYCASSVNGGCPQYHRVRVMCNAAGDLYFNICGIRVPVDTCMRVMF